MALRITRRRTVAAGVVVLLLILAVAVLLRGATAASNPSLHSAATSHLAAERSAPHPADAHDEEHAGYVVHVLGACAAVLAAAIVLLLAARAVMRLRAEVALAQHTTPRRVTSLARSRSSPDLTALCVQIC